MVTTVWDKINGVRSLLVIGSLFCAMIGYSYVNQYKMIRQQEDLVSLGSELKEVSKLVSEIKNQLTAVGVRQEGMIKSIDELKERP